MGGALSTSAGPPPPARRLKWRWPAPARRIIRPGRLMTTLLTPPTPSIPPVAVPDTVADLLHRLGDVPAFRVRLRPPPGQATVQDVLDVHAREKRLCELVDGTLVEKGMSYRESALAV